MRRVLFTPGASSTAAAAAAAAVAAQPAGRLRWFVLVGSDGGSRPCGTGGGRGDAYTESQAYLKKSAGTKTRAADAPELTLFRAVAPKRLPYVGFASDLEEAAERLAEAGRLPEEGGQLRAVRKLQTRRLTALLKARRVEEKAAIAEWVAAGGRSGDDVDDDDGHVHEEAAAAQACMFTERRWVERRGVVRARRHFDDDDGGGCETATNWLRLQPGKHYSYEVLDQRGRRVHLGVSSAPEAQERQRLQRRGVLKSGFHFRRVQNEDPGPEGVVGA